MGETAANSAQSDESGTGLFAVRPTKKARQECRDLFRAERETLWVISQLRLLMHWPLDEMQQEQLGSNLDFSKVHHRNETFFELRLDDARLHQRNLRVFFWVDDGHRTIWIVHAYWKKTDRLDDAVKTRVARRVRALRGGPQTGRRI